MDLPQLGLYLEKSGDSNAAHESIGTSLETAQEGFSNVTAGYS